MSRPLKKIDIPPAIDPTLDQNKLNAADLALVEQGKEVAALATLFKYDGPVRVELLVLQARELGRRSVESFLQLGATLCMLKAQTPHGDFMARCAEIGIADRSARRAMSVALRVAKTDKLAVLTASASVAALTELAFADDDVIEDLEAAGALDAFDKMTASQVRKKVREQEKIIARLKAVNEEQGDELALKRDLKLAATDWPERFKGLLDQVDLAHRALVGNVEGLAKIMVAAFEDPVKPGEEETLDMARTHLAERMDQALEASFRRLENLRAVFDRGLGVYALDDLGAKD